MANKRVTRRAKLEIIERLLQRMREQMEGAATKVSVSVADFVRLVQLYKELEEEQPKEVVVTWVEKSGKEKSGKK